MRNPRTALAIALISLVCYGSAHAGAGVSLGPTAGISKAPDEDANVVVGAALRLRPLPALGFEGSINYRQEEFAAGALTVRSWPVQATGMLYPVPIVYAAVGAGWYMTTFDFNDGAGVVLDDETDGEFGWHFGGGAEIPLGAPVKLVADVRYVFLNYDFEAVPGSGQIDSDFYLVTAGVLFNL